MLFSVGNSDDRAFLTAVNWPSRGPLEGIRFVIIRPGLVQPSSSPAVDFSLQNFPANEADYREQFGNLDLEFRFEILTDITELRAATVEPCGMRWSRCALPTNKLSLA